MFWFKKWRRARIANGPFPIRWLEIIGRNVPYYKLLPAADGQELRRHVLVFLDEKRFEGCGGVTITDEIKVTIAAQACILLLGRRTDYYPGLTSILVYPQAYIAGKTEYLGGGIVAEGTDIRIGESWHRGAVVLSWDDVKKSAKNIRDGRNVVLHEFAHQLDGSAGRGDSSSVLADRSEFKAWARKMQQDYQKLCRDVRSGGKTLLDEYGATNPAEFFAVATEYFFERGKELQRIHPQLYGELKRFYNQDPAAFATGGGPQ